MTKTVSIETTGRNEDDAIAAALRQLGKERDDVSVTVLERAKSGFFGLGATPAKVRVEYEVEEKDSKVQRAEEFLQGLFQRMDVTAEIHSEYQEENNLILIELTGEHMGSLIGRRGETLDAIQHLTTYVVNNGADERTRINIDAENYRAKRAESLTRLAQKVAAKVARSRRSLTLEPMNAYERHVIHTALQDYENVTTYSTGTEPNRRVVVAYERTVLEEHTERPSQTDRPDRPVRPARPDRPVRPPRTDRPRQDDRPGPDETPPASDEPKTSTPREWH